MSAADVPVSRPTATDSVEAALVARVRAGEADAFEPLVRRYAGRMLATARRLLRNHDDAHEVVQEAFLSAWRSLHTFCGSACFGTWIHRITINAALMRLRARGCRPEAPICDLLPRFVDDGHRLEPQTRWPDRAQAELLDDEDRRFVRAAIDRLPENYRTVILLRDIEDQSTDAAAAVLGITPNAVKIRLHRARQALRTLLESRFRPAS